MGDPLKGNALDSWRGLCALLVALFHFPVAGLVADNPFIRSSYLFVDFFFVLSGFVIAAVQDRRPDPFGPFLIKRFGRIWPMHALVLAAFVAVAVLQGDLNADERHSVLAILTNVFMVHAWGVHADLTWNDPSWSISVEWLLYLLFALLAFVPGRRFIYAVFVAGAILTLFFFAPNGMGSTFDFGVARGLAGFFVGALIARAPMQDFGTLGEIGATFAVFLFVMAEEAQFAAPFIFGAAVYVFAGSRGALTRALLSAPVRWIGERSYTLYITHALVVAGVWAGSRALGWDSAAGRILIGPMGDLMVVPYLVAILTLAWLCYPIEDRARRWFKAQADRRPVETRQAA